MSNNGKPSSNGDVNVSSPFLSSFPENSVLLHESTSLLVEEYNRAPASFETSLPGDASTRAHTITSSDELVQKNAPEERLVKSEVVKRSNGDVASVKRWSKWRKNLRWITRDFLSSNDYMLTTHSTVETSVHFTLKKCSNLQTLMNLVKGTTGTAILTLPLAFNNAGLWVGFIGFFTIACMAVHSMHILIKCADLLEKRSKLHIQTYPQLVGQCFQYGPKRLQSWAPKVKIFVMGLINTLQPSFCCVYIVWVAVNVKQVIDTVWPGSPDVRVYEVMVFALLLPYIMVKSLKTLAFFSTIANVCYILGLIIIFQYILKDLPSVSNRPAFNSLSLLPMFFGTAVFSFESISLILPMKSKMENQEDMGGWSGVLNLAMVIIAVSYAATGFYGALQFGDDIASTITLNLPNDQWLYLSVNLMFAVGVFISVGVQIYVPFNDLWPPVNRKLLYSYPAVNTALAEFLFRAGFLVIILVVALLVPHIDILMALVGSIFGGLLALIIPASIEIITLHQERELTLLIVIKDVVIIIFGVIGLLTGTYTSIVDIIESF